MATDASKRYLSVQLSQQGGSLSIGNGFATTHLLCGDRNQITSRRLSGTPSPADHCKTVFPQIAMPENNSEGALSDFLSIQSHAHPEMRPHWLLGWRV